MIQNTAQIQLLKDTMLQKEAEYKKLSDIKSKIDS
jgi:hypothetical protein